MRKKKNKEKKVSVKSLLMIKKKQNGNKPTQLKLKEKKMYGKSYFLLKKKRELRQIYPLLQKLSTSSGKNRKKIIQQTSDKQLNLITECMYNAIYNIKLLSLSQREFLKKYLQHDKSIITALLRLKMKPLCRRKICCNMEDCIGLIISAILPCLYNFVK